jgi:hypothetical protein
MVPPYVEREFQGEKGVLSLWVDSKHLLEIMEQGIKMPETVLKQVDDMKYVTRLWYCLIANDDPTQENLKYTEDWRTILIDHSRAFRSDKKYTERLVLGIAAKARSSIRGAEPGLCRYAWIDNLGRRTPPKERRAA